MSYKRSVYVVARPISLLGLIPIVGTALGGNFSFCHWGMLVSEWSTVDLQAMVLRSTGVHGEDVALGILFELLPLENNFTSFRITEPFGALIIQKEWRPTLVAYAGTTTLRNEELQAVGKFSVELKANRRG